MARIRVSTTVDEDKLLEARRISGDTPDSKLIDEALEALLAHHRGARVDQTYEAYEQHPLEEPDAWGDLASFRRAAAAS